MLFSEQKQIRLLNGRFDPITFSYGFLEAPLPVIVDAVVHWRSSLGVSVEATPLNAPFHSLFHSLEPLTMPPSKELLLATTSEWTAYFNNAIHGSDPFPPMSYLSLKLKCRGVVALSSPNSQKPTGKSYGAVGFWLLSPTNRQWLNVERSILSMNDGGKWKFSTMGEVLNFEDTACYMNKKISDRFTTDMLRNYCEAMGINIFSHNFYQKKGILVNHKTKLAATTPQFSLLETRRMKGLIDPEESL